MSAPLGARSQKLYTTTKQNRSNENFGIEEIFEKFGVIAELQSGDVGSAGGAQPETVYNDKTNRYD